MKLRFFQVLLAAVAICTAGAATAQTEFVSIDRFVGHTSTVDANAGERVPLFVHEKLSRETAALIARGESPADVVLFIHGGSVPSVPDYDLPFKDYSWMEYLAEAGFDTFSMDQTGYGRSPRPTMDDPCNVSPGNQGLLIPNPLADTCDPSYEAGLTSFATDWDEIDTVVDFIRNERNVDRVHLIGWSRGGPRAGGYAASHPDKVGNIVLFAPAYSRFTGPANQAGPEVPMVLQTRDALMNARWRDGVVCENQIDPGIQEVIWQTIMSFDPYGSAWGPEEGIMRYPTSQRSAWTPAKAAAIESPTLILVGVQDSLLNASRELYPDMTGTSRKVLVEMDCATHMAVWEETQYRFMHEASLEWLQQATYRGETAGTYAVGINGTPKDQ